MKRKSRALAVLLLAALMLFASCEQTTPVPPAEEPKEEQKQEETYLPAEILPIPDEISFAAPRKLTDPDPEHPYDAIHSGLFDNQTFTSTSTPKGGEMASVVTTSRYSIYVPETGQPKIPCIVILTPNDTTAAQFARTEEGMAWIKEAHETGAFAVAFAEPYMGKEWNLTLASPTEENGLRDEKAFGLDMFKSVRTKAISDDMAFINVDKNGVSIAGYEEGATMAAVLAAAWPQTYANCIAIDPKGFDDSVASLVENILRFPTYPHNSEYDPSSSNYGTIKAGDIPMPMYVSRTADEKKVIPATQYTEERTIIWNSGKSIQKIWEGVNAHALTINEDSSSDLELFVSEFLTGNETTHDLASLALLNLRARGYAGGTLRLRENQYDEAHWLQVEEKMEDGRLRRWRIYTPDSYDESKATPLVMCLHGSTAAIEDIVDESKWTKVADDNGFVVVFAQGYPGGIGDPDSTHAPSWDTRGPKDIPFILHVVEDVKAKRNIDDTRVYLTGHSLGAMMTQNIMSNEKAAKVFAAFAPVGSFSKPSKNAPAIQMPVYGLMGEWEFRSSEITADAWAERWTEDLTKSAPFFLEGYTEGKFKTWEYRDAQGNTPVRLTQVIDSPHVYMAEESEIIWNDFFSKIARDENGKTVYIGK